MKNLIFLLICFAIFQKSFAVRSCYSCINEECKDGEIEKHKKDCRSKTDVENHFLCKSQTFGNGSVIKSCMKNDDDLIKDCNEVHIKSKGNDICIHCDREYCNDNSSSNIFEPVMLSVLFFSFLTLYIQRY